ncbi:hypothetical protein DFJ74DRAFT_714441 [Hyaloraphidium curvatum]|nr:hypothetical protein DFJ74DRAFT_714441 [Hyaloraphidium curvatum]
MADTAPTAVAYLDSPADDRPSASPADTAHDADAHDGDPDSPDDASTASTSSTAGAAQARHGQRGGRAPREGTNRLNVLITGGSSGIGRSLVLRFAEAGHRVLFTFFSNPAGAAEVVAHCAQAEGKPLDETSGLLDTLAAAPGSPIDLAAARNTVLRGPGGAVTAAFLDQGDPASTSAISDLVATWLPPGTHLDVLVNNAALGSRTVETYVRLKSPPTPADPDSLLPLPYRHDLALLRVNSLGPVWLTSRLSPHLSPRARILLLGSVGGNSGVFPEYRASDLMSKAALGYAGKHMAARWMADTPGGAWGPEGYPGNESGASGAGWTVITVAPGATQTAMFRASNPAEAAGKHAGTFPPRGRLIDPEEIAELVYYCGAGKGAEVLHGAVVDASLGLGSRWGVQTERPR